MYRIAINNRILHVSPEWNQMIKRRKRKQLDQSQRPISALAMPVATLSIPYSDDKTGKRFDICVCLILLALGTYTAIALWAACPVPNPDFPGYIGTGRTLLNFDLPSNFKRAPGVGVFQMLINYAIGGNNELVAAWLLNSILTPIIAILTYLIAKRFIKFYAAFFAVIVVLHPMLLTQQVNPIAETTMIFFILLTFFLSFRHSRWAYLAASIASLVRYECAALLIVIFTMDVLEHRSKKGILTASAFLMVASTPFALWMLGTYLTMTPTSSHYLKHYSGGVSKAIGMGYINLIWDGGVRPLLQTLATAKAKFLSYSAGDPAANIKSVLHPCTQAITVIGILVALVHTIVKRNWKMIAFFLFLSMYIFAHAMKPHSHHRYTVPILCPLLLIAFYGLMLAGGALIDKLRMSIRISLILQIALLAGILYWIVLLVPHFAKLSIYCVKGMFLPYAGMAAGAMILITGIYFYGKKFLNINLLITVFVCLMLISMQFSTARTVGNGTRMEFKFLLDAYLANSEPGERIASRYAGTLRLMAPSRRDDFVSSLKYLSSTTFDEFVEKCYDNNITFVSWSNRGSRGSKGELISIAPVLSKQQNCPPLIFVKRVQVNTEGINVFKLLPKHGSAAKE